MVLIKYSQAYYWTSLWSPIYVSGERTVTVSIGDAASGHSWAIDVAAAARSDAIERAA